MKQDVTVIPVDKVILVDGVALFFDFNAPATLHALQWHGGAGETEWMDGPNRPLAEEDYADAVAPYVALWEAEKARLEQDANKPPTLDEARAAKLADLMAAYDAAFAPVDAIYPAKERETWPVQLEEAAAALANPEAETPMLSIMAAARGQGETPADLARIVMENNALYRQLAGALTGQQQRMYKEINALDNVDALHAYEVAFTIPQGLNYPGA